MAVVTPRATAIVALDVGSTREALKIVRALGPLCGFYKVGLELFTAEGPAVVRAVREAGSEVFLDLKLHDIPNTVRGAARSAARMGVRLVTVHASGGRAMIEAAVDGAASEAGPGCGILAVSVLTSMGAADLGESWGRKSGELDVRAEVLRLAGLARTAGAHGLVCSGGEVRAVRDAHGDSLALLVPGIRFAGDAGHDQARVVTPRGAVEAGARYLVLGRTVTSASDMATAMRRALDEMA
jgi:orotidine-5'-phosphate decarboxylase